MSFTLTAVQQTEFDSFVKAEYQSKGFRLKESIRNRSEVTGRFVDFRKVGQIQAVETAYLQSVTPQDPNYDKATATLKKFTAPTAVDSVQELTVNFDTKMENAMLVANAMGRRCDQIIINAMDGNAGTTIVDGGLGFNYAKFTEIWENFEENAVPKGERYIAASAKGFQQLMQDDQFVSTFYTQNRVLDRGYVLEYLGINLITIPKMVEGGLPLAGDVRSCFAWHKESMGMGIGHNFRTEIHYVPEKTMWLINGVFSAGAVVIDDTGLIQFDIDESV